MDVLHRVELEPTICIQEQELLIGHLVVFEFNGAVNAARVALCEAVNVIELQHPSSRREDDVVN